MADFVTGNRFLSQSEMETNARYIYNYLGSRGWTVNAIAGMLGNMQSESTINPGIWENLDAGVGPGFGLVQWTPYTKYTNWCADRRLDPSHIDSALQRIEWEFENGEQYYPSDYDISAQEFKTSTQAPGFLAMVFLANYERPADYNQPNRATQAEAWYEFLTGEPAPVDPSTPGTKKRKSLPLLLMFMATRRRV